MTNKVDNFYTMAKMGYLMQTMIILFLCVKVFSEVLVYRLVIRSQ